MYDLDPAELSRHELRVLKALSDFITHHQPGSSLSAIDNIVLMYVVGVLEDVGNDDDDFDVDNFIEMIAAYVPGFQSIDVALVYEWIFELIGKLKTEDHDRFDVIISDSISGQERQLQNGGTTDTSRQGCDSSSNVKSDSGCSSETSTCHPETESDTIQEDPGHSESISLCSNSSLTKVARGESLRTTDEPEAGADEGLEENLDQITSSQDTLLSSELKNLEEKRERTTHEDSGIWEMKLTPEESDHFRTIQEIVPDASEDEIRRSLVSCGGDLEQAVEMLVEKMTLEESRAERKVEKSRGSLDETPIIFKAKPNNQEQKKRRRRSKTQRENRDRNPPQKENLIPEKQTYSVNNIPESKDDERLLLELFPAASRIDAQQCLSIANGDIEGAVQLLMEKVNSGDIQRTRPVVDHFPRSKVIDDKKQRELLLQKYSFVDADEQTKEHRPFLPKPEKKKLVRYYDNKKVTNKGEKYFEMKSDE